jgi:hypothetical protein
LIEKAATHHGRTEQKALRSAYHRATKNNEATAPQIAAQSPSDSSNVTIKDGPVSGE